MTQSRDTLRGIPDGQTAQNPWLTLAQHNNFESLFAISPFGRNGGDQSLLNQMFDPF